MTHQTTTQAPNTACAQCQAQVSAHASPVAAPSSGNTQSTALQHAAPIRRTAQVKRGRVYAHVPLDMA